MQHLRIVDLTTCMLLHLFFRSLEKTHPLFDSNDSNPYQYRKRWNLLLEVLESYLQEAASVNALVDMPPHARKAVCSAAKVFNSLPAACS